MTEPLTHDVAGQLAHAMVRLRAESEPSKMRWTWSQVSVLGRIAREGPTTVSALATAGHVRPQPMTEIIAALLREGLISRRAGPTDGSKTLISIEPVGHELISSIPAVRETWLEGAIDRPLSPTERLTLAMAALIMERLAGS